MDRSSSKWVPMTPQELWSQRREAALNWLALGMLLAAWNAADDGDVAHRRPQSLRGYAQVSVRAVTRSAAMHAARDSASP
ncbi:MAG TPA: hypothetical protein VME42_11255 [Steroidobacteraceae bacterium]|nr:hypothetical protein [Steroidobacteraceae bacterium]